MVEFQTEVDDPQTVHEFMIEFKEAIKNSLSSISCTEHTIDCFYVVKDSLNAICPACIISLKLSHENLVFIP